MGIAVGLLSPSDIDSQAVETMWSIYDNAFTGANQDTPCKQSYDRDQFAHALSDDRIHKWVVRVDGRIVGVGLVTNHLECVPWISVAYFKKHHSDLFDKGLIYYLLGIAVDSQLSSIAPGRELLSKMIGSLPELASVVFDHSETANPAIAVFARRALPRQFRHEVLDRQTYVMCRWSG
jgi:hypothetical protein